MKAITANLLRTGEVVYLAQNGDWGTDLNRAQIFTDEEALQAALSKVEAQVLTIADVYPIDVSRLDDGTIMHAGRAALRESIRQTGPTIAFETPGNF